MTLSSSMSQNLTMASAQATHITLFLATLKSLALPLHSAQIDQLLFPSHLSTKRLHTIVVPAFGGSRGR